MTVKNNCERLGMPDNCELANPMFKCSGIADANGDGKEDYIVATAITTMNKDTYTTIITPADIVYNGTNLNVQRSEAQQNEEMSSVAFTNSSGSVTFKVNDRVTFEGQTYVVKKFVPIATCDKDGNLAFDRKDTLALIVPEEIAKLEEPMRESTYAGLKKLHVLKTKLQILEGEEYKKVKQEADALVESLKTIDNALKGLFERIKEEIRQAQLDDLVKVE